MKIAIVRLSALGDIIHSFIIPQAIKKHFQDAQIDWFVDEKFADILQSSLINRVYALPIKAKKYNKAIKILKQAKKNNYDAIIDAQGLIKSAIVAKMLGKNIYGFDKQSAKESVASFFYKHKANIDYGENIVKRNLFLAAFFLKDYKKEIFKKDDNYLANSPFFNILAKKPYFDTSKYNEIRNLDLNKSFILFFIGASKSDKMYSVDGFIDLAKQIQNDLKGLKIYIIWGSENEHKMAQKIKSNTQNVDILPPLKLQELSYVVLHSKAIIGNDSGPTHLGFAQNIPSITLFRFDNHKRNTFSTNINKVMQNDTMEFKTIEICEKLQNILKLKGCLDG